MKGNTLQRVASPTAILVNLPEPLATTVAEQLADGGLKVLRVGHVAAACERIPVTMPQVVAIPTSLSPADAESLVDRCVAVGAEVLKVSADMDPLALKKLLRDAANMAIVRSLRRGT